MISPPGRFTDLFVCAMTAVGRFLSLFWWATCIVATTLAAEEVSRPNIVLIVADDLGEGGGKVFKAHFDIYYFFLSNCRLQRRLLAQLRHRLPEPGLPGPRRHHPGELLRAAHLHSDQGRTAHGILSHTHRETSWKILIYVFLDNFFPVCLSTLPTLSLLFRYTSCCHKSLRACTRTSPSCQNISTGLATPPTSSASELFTHLPRYQV